MVMRHQSFAFTRTCTNMSPQESRGSKAKPMRTVGGIAFLTETQQSVLAVAVPAAAAIAVVALTALSAYLAAKRERRRRLYGDSFRAACAWREMLYRIRRRPDKGDPEHALIARFHDLQEDLDFYVGWIGSESKHMQRSYERLVRSTKTATKGPIARAWSEPIRPPGEATLDADDHPNLEAAKNRFLEDVRSHLSPWPWRRIAVMLRNRRTGHHD